MANRRNMSLCQEGNEAGFEYLVTSGSSLIFPGARKVRENSMQAIEKHDQCWLTLSLELRPIIKLPVKEVLVISYLLEL